MTDLLDRLMKKTVLVGDCWIWTGAIRPDGYGAIKLGGRGTPTRLVHRVGFMEVRGPILAANLDHLCRVPPCWNPWHLEPVTSRENTIRGRLSAFREGKQSRFPGVRWDTSGNRKKKWLAAIEVEGKTINLGRYFSEEEAAEAYDRARSHIE